MRKSYHSDEKIINIMGIIILIIVFSALYFYIRPMPKLIDLSTADSLVGIIIFILLAIALKLKIRWS